MVHAAAKRLGMQNSAPPADSATAQPRRARSMDTTAMRNKSVSFETPKLNFGREGDADDDDGTPVLVLESEFDVSTVTSLRPGESGVLLVEGAEAVEKNLNRFAGSTGAAAVIAPSKYASVKVEPLELVLQFTKKEPDQPDRRYTSLAYLYRLTAETPKLVQEVKLLKLSPSRRSTVLGVEVLPSKEVQEITDAVKQEKVDYEAVKKALIKLLPEQCSLAILECFMAKQTDTTVRFLCRVTIKERDELLRKSGTKGIFWAPELDKRAMYGVVWLQVTEAQDAREAVRAAQQVDSWGAVTRLDQKAEVWHPGESRCQR